MSVEDVEKDEKTLTKKRRLALANEILSFVLLSLGVAYFCFQAARELVEEIREALLLLAAMF